ncbi:MAG TPA: Clp protease N-terminal domain-containing protein, partial [Ktedonobacterales bacterium]|nr:Clp protease N-terminal domain-containing protein [Ktedonobacterales bacterium]
SLAQDEAQRFNHNYIGTEHLLLGLVREGDGVAAKVLANLGVELNKVRSAVEFTVGRGDRPVRSEVGLTPRAKKVMELAVDEARRLNHHYIGTEHLLLGLIREGGGIAAGVLESLGVSLERARNAVTDMLASGMTATSGSGARTSESEPFVVTPPATGPKNNVVTCRLDDAAVDALDALVEAGIRSTRSDAAAWLISAGIEAHRELFDRVNATVSEIRKLRLEARDIAQQMTRDAAGQETPESDESTNTEGEAKDPEEPDDLDDLNRLDEPPTA